MTATAPAPGPVPAAASAGAAPAGDEQLVRLIASALARMARQRTVTGPVVYPPVVQRAYNQLVLRCLERGDTAPGSVPEMVRWAAERPLHTWPLTLPEDFPAKDAALVDPGTRTPTQLCLEWEVMAADPAVELFENERILEALAACRAAQAPDSYTAFRRLLTTRPVLTGAELALLGGDIDLGLLHAIIKRCYEPVPAAYAHDGKYLRCTRCRCLMAPLARGGGHRCELDRCRREGKGRQGEPVSPRKGGLFHLSRPLRMFITSPGLAETDLEEDLKERGITAGMWPQYDAYDLRVPLPDGRVWAVDVKDRADPVLLARGTRPFRNDPPFDRAFLVVPRYRFRDNEAYGRLFARHVAREVADHVTLLDDRAFLEEIDTVLSPLSRRGGHHA